MKKLAAKQKLAEELENERMQNEIESLKEKPEISRVSRKIMRDRNVGNFAEYTFKWEKSKQQKLDVARYIDLKQSSVSV